MTNGIDAFKEELFDVYNSGLAEQMYFNPMFKIYSKAAYPDVYLNFSDYMFFIYDERIAFAFVRKEPVSLGYNFSSLKFTIVDISHYEHGQKNRLRGSRRHVVITTEKLLEIAPDDLKNFILFNLDGFGH
jgi:hypothetical protein